MKAALKFILLLGVVSLFADVTYEGARSITGPYLAILGASGAAVGFVIGFGEFIGYGMRVFFGHLADKTRAYWVMTFIGYAINLLAVPLLALAGNWPVAACLIIFERLGKAVRVPPRDAMLSFATKHTGRGWGFGIHESLDQIGAILGPLIVTAVLYFRGSYQTGFAILLIPALLALATLAIARFTYPRPRDFEKAAADLKTKGLNKTFWIYVLAVGLVGAGFVDFALIAYHFEKADVVPQIWIPFFYAIAMGVDGLSALVMGRLFDIKGFYILAIVTVISCLFAPLVFLGGFTWALIGMILWGIGMGSQESIMRAAVAYLIPPHKRGSAYGFLNLGFGTFWFIGSAIMGLLYDVSIIYLVVFSLLAQLASVPFFLSLKRFS